MSSAAFNALGAEASSDPIQIISAVSTSTSLAMIPTRALIVYYVGWTSVECEYCVPTLRVYPTYVPSGSCITSCVYTGRDSVRRVADILSSVRAGV